jgi:Tol biopolymer transport system component
MKAIILSIIIICYCLTIVCYSQSWNVKGPYFGQTPPGNTPRLFAPGILTQPNGVVVVTRIAFSPDGNECFFSGPTDWNFSSTRMYYTKCINNVWTPHVLASFFPGYSCRQPFFSADGNTLYFSSNKNGTSDIWMVVRGSEGWGTPQVLPAPINTSSYEGMYTQTIDGTAYIESDRPGGRGKFDVWRISPKKPGQLQQIQNLGAPVNTSGNDNDPFVSPNGRYLIFSSNYNDLFVTYNKGNGRWTEPINLNKYYPGINTDDQEYAPCISSNGRYLFFTRITGGGVYWVSISCIDSLRNNNFPPYVNRKIPNQLVRRDSLFNYQIPDSTFVDDDGNNTLTYSATLSDGTSLPSWLNFNPETKTFSGTLTDSGEIILAVTATDTEKESVSCTFAFNIIDNLKKRNDKRKQ